MDQRDLNPKDYAGMTEVWKKDLCRLGWEPTWNEDGPAYRPSDSDSEGLSLYDAWCKATGTPAVMKIGMGEKSFEGGGDDF